MPVWVQYTAALLGLCLAPLVAGCNSNSPPSTGTPAAAPGGASSAKAATGGEKANPAASASVPAQLVADREANNPLDAQRAFSYLTKVCALGPRASGTPAMRRQQELLTAHFQALGGKVERQEFQVAHPLTRRPVPMANLIVRWHPERKERVLLCAHYDTRPLPDQDPDPIKRRRGTFIGANDGASGVALLMELAHFLPELDTKYGVDFALFDGEELVYDDDRHPYCLGSTYFALQYVKHPPEHEYRWAVLVDMVGDEDLQIYYEVQSHSWRDTRPLVRQIWSTAHRLGVDEFVPRPKYTINDDHVPLRQVAGIPACDIIDFDYPYWHTEADVPSNCSGESLAKVGWVVLEWMRSTR